VLEPVPAAPVEEVPVPVVVPAGVPEELACDEADSEAEDDDAAELVSVCENEV
jgi:hypothetical protein